MTAEHISGRSEPRPTGPPVIHEVRCVENPLYCTCGWAPTTIERGHTLEQLLRLEIQHTGGA